MDIYTSVIIPGQGISVISTLHILMWRHLPDDLPYSLDITPEVGELAYGKLAPDHSRFEEAGIKPLIAGTPTQ